MSPPDRIQGLALGLHPDVAIVLEHLAGHVACDIHNCLIASAALSQLCDQRVP